MAKSAEQFRQSAADKMQKNVPWNNTNFINIPSDASTTHELGYAKAKIQALESKHGALLSEKAVLEGNHAN